MDLVNSLYWIRLSIGDIAEVVAGGTPKAGDPENFKDPGTGVPWLTPADLSGYSEMYIGLGSRDLSQKGYDSSSAKLLPKGSLLFSSRAPIGYVAIAKNDISTNQGFKNFVFPYGVNSRYAYYYLRSIRDVAERMGTGTTFKEISGATAKTLPFLLPPLEEQAVIAEKLNNLLAQVETTKARLERIPEILKTFRQSVLAAALSGKLTEGWRTAQKFDRLGIQKQPEQEKWRWPDIPESWAVKWYPEVVESRLGKMLDKAKNTGKPTKYLGNINVRWFSFDLTNTQEILISESERFELSLKINDVLICEGGEPGRCAVWKSNTNESIIFQKALHRARVKSEMIPEWLVFNLKHDADNLSLEQLFTGTTIKHLTGKALKRYPLRIPPIEEQTEIVHRVEEIFTFADSIEKTTKAALERINNLTQSILAKAFRGELTADWRAANQELITGHNSAETLLEKIKEERQKLKPTRKARTKK